MNYLIQEIKSKENPNFLRMRNKNECLILLNAFSMPIFMIIPRSTRVDGLLDWSNIVYYLPILKKYTLISEIIFEIITFS